MRRALAPFSIVLAAGLLALALAAWRATAREVALPLGDADRSAASEAVYLFAAMSAHLRGTGDPRYAERLPAAPEVTDALLAEIEYARHGGRAEEPRLVRMEPRAARALGRDHVEVLTKEFWITRDLAAADARPRSDVVLVRYELRRQFGTWRIVDWSVDAPPPEARGGAER